MKHRVDKGVLSTKKGLGYILAIVGLIFLVIGLGYLSIDDVFNGNPTNSTNSTMISEELSNKIGTVPSYIFTIVGAGLILFGIIILSKNPKKTRVGQEVPIYSGNQVIGYRRH